LSANESSSTESHLDQPSSSESYEFENTTVNTANVSQNEEVENEEVPGDVYIKLTAWCS
jgi:hypothetical protein